MNEDSGHLLKKLIWAYLLLLIFEGALRKWVLPGLATPLLLIRDPLALWLIFKAWQRNLLPSNIYLFFIILIGAVSTFVAVLVGHGSLGVALFGARIFLIHLPLIFVIGRVFDYDDVIKVGKVVLWLAVPMTVLVALQFYSPQSAWVNRGVGGDIEGAGFGGALGFYRPPGTFSFTNGNTLFFSFLACYVVYFWFDQSRVNRILLVCASIALIAAIPLSISRGLFFQAAVTLAFASIIAFYRPKYTLHLIWVVLIGVIIVIGLGNTEFFQTATEAFNARYDNANETEGGLEGVLGGRFLGSMFRAVERAGEFPFFGYGLGISTNVGKTLLPDNAGAGIYDFEWERLIMELGTLLGLLTIIVRVSLSVKIAYASHLSLKAGNLLPWMLLSFGSLSLVQAQWAQPTSLGFCTLISGLMISSLKNSKGSN